MHSNTVNSHVELTCNNHATYEFANSLTTIISQKQMFQNISQHAMHVDM